MPSPSFTQVQIFDRPVHREMDRETRKEPEDHAQSKTSSQSGLSGPSPGIPTNISSIIALSLGRFDPSSVLLIGSIRFPRLGPLPPPSPRISPGLEPLPPASPSMGCGGSVGGDLGIEMQLQVCSQRATSPARCSRAEPYSQEIPDLIARAVSIPSRLCDPLVPSGCGLSLVKINDAGVADVRGRHAHPRGGPPPFRRRLQYLLAPISILESGLRLSSRYGALVNLNWHKAIVNICWKPPYQPST